MQIVSYSARRIYDASNEYIGEAMSDVLSETGISGHLRYKDAFSIYMLDSVTSTNTVLREKAVNGASEGCVIVADEQTAGKGRLGRTFYSAAKHGAYFSLLLRPAYDSRDAVLITPAAAVAATRAIKDVFGVKAGIKWVNDLLVSGRKVCGILTEASFNSESGAIESAILGVGINITAPESGYPEEIAGTAGAITGMQSVGNNERCALIAAVLDYFWEYYQDLPERSFLEDYRALSVVTGKDIFVMSSGEKKPARALYIDDDCGLAVRYAGGDVATLRSGEVSIRVRGEE